MHLSIYMFLMKVICVFFRDKSIEADKNSVNKN